MSEHTKRPWKVSDTSIITSDDRYCIAVIEDDGGYEAPPEQREANKILIAAAPDLLAALENILALASDPAGSTLTLREVFGTGHHTAEIEGRNARAAIAKAKGNQ